MPVPVPGGTEISLQDGVLRAKGPKGELEQAIHPFVSVSHEDGELRFEPAEENQGAHAMTGTMRALVSNMVTGVNDGFERKLTIIGVGYRAQVKDSVLNLTLGFSHPVDYAIPDGITVETPTQTEVIVKGADKQRVGQVAAEIRSYRPPEPYKGKGVRYSDEHVVRKQAKKK
jgi:large subunit ribosomal protein L6